MILSTKRLIIKSFVATATIIMVSTLAACQRPLTPETSCSFQQNQDQQRISWGRALPVPIYIHSSVPKEAYEAIASAMKVYDEAIGQKAFEIKGYSVDGPATPQRDGYSFIYWMSEWEADRDDEQGRTTIYWSGDTIYEADVRINASAMSHFTFHYGSTAPVQGIDLKSLFVHELGHVLGLDHNDSHGSIMATHLRQNTVRTQLSTEDASNISCEYGPTT